MRLDRNAAAALGRPSALRAGAAAPAPVLLDALAHLGGLALADPYDKDLADRALKAMFEGHATADLKHYAVTLFLAYESQHITSRELARSLERAPEIAKLPSIDVRAEITNGSGGIGRHFVALLRGREVVLKTDRRFYPSMDAEEAVLRNLQPFGAPEVLGRFRIAEPRSGVWCEAVAMEKIDGVDLQRLSMLKEGGKPLPFPVTAAHLQWILDLEKRLTAQNLRFYEVNFGDFILTRDPLRPVVPVDMELRDAHPNAPRAGLVMAGPRSVAEAIEGLIGLACVRP